MASIDEIKDYQSLQTWLTSRPQADSAALAYRIVLRRLPDLGRVMDQSWQTEAGFTTLRVLRSALTTGVAVRNPTDEISSAFRKAHNAVDDALGDANRDTIQFKEFAQDAAQEARSSAALAADPAYVAREPDAASEAAELSESAAEMRAEAKKAVEVERFERSANGFAETFNPAVMAAFAEDASSAASHAARTSLSVSDAKSWEQVTNDAAALREGKNLLLLPLWHSGAPDWLANTDPKMRAIWAADPPAHWTFWTRWWEGVLTGKPLDWDLQHDIALIPDKVWKAGPGPVAEAIVPIDERFDLKAQVEAIMEHLRQYDLGSSEQAASAEHRSHNHPPELLEAQVEVRREVTVVSAALDEAKTELTKPLPNPSIVRRVGMVVIVAAERARLYVASLMHLTIKTVLGATAVAIGKELGSIIVESAPEVLSGILEWALKIGQDLISFAGKLRRGS